MSQNDEILVGEEILQTLTQGDLIIYPIDGRDVDTIYIEYYMERIKDAPLLQFEDNEMRGEVPIVHLATRNRKRRHIISMKFHLDEIAIVGRRLTYLNEDFKIGVRFEFLFDPVNRKLGNKLASKLERSLSSDGSRTYTKPYNEQEYRRLNNILKMYYDK